MCYLAIRLDDHNVTQIPTNIPEDHECHSVQTAGRVWVKMFPDDIVMLVSTQKDCS